LGLRARIGDDMPEEDSHHVAHDCFNRRRETVAAMAPRSAKRFENIH
jgi:hypothetical protein